MSNVKTTFSSRKMLSLLGVLFCLVSADGVISNFLVSQGIAWEWNPFLTHYVETEPFLVVKAMAALSCVIALWFLYKRSPKIVAVSSVLASLAYTLIVYWNVGLAIAYYL